MVVEGKIATRSEELKKWHQHWSLWGQRVAVLIVAITLFAYGLKLVYEDKNTAVGGGLIGVAVTVFTKLDKHIALRKGRLDRCVLRLNRLLDIIRCDDQEKLRKIRLEVDETIRSEKVQNISKYFRGQLTAVNEFLASGGEHPPDWVYVP